MSDSGQHYDSTLGALEIGVMTAIFLFGLVTVQTFTYYRRFPYDSRRLKIFVAVIWLLELSHTAASAHAIYSFTIKNYGRPETIEQFPITMTIIAVLFSAIIGPMIQAYFANRIRIISGRLVLPCICWALSFLRCAFLVAVAVTSYKSPTVSYFTQHWRWVLASALSISAGVDVLTAASLCYLLYKRRCQGIKSTQRIIDRLIAWTIQTGLLSSIATVTMLVLFLTVNNYAWLAMFFILSRLFSNSFIALLNARVLLRGIGAQPEATDIFTSVPPTTREFVNGPTTIDLDLSQARQISTDNETSSLELHKVTRDARQ